MSQNVTECPINEKNFRLNPRKLLVIHYLAAGKTPNWIQEETKISRKTIERWKKQPEFDRQLREDCAKMRASLRQELEDLSVMAVRYLKDEMGDSYSWGSREERQKISLNVLRMIVDIAMCEKNMNNPNFV